MYDQGIIDWHTKWGHPFCMVVICYDWIIGWKSNWQHASRMVVSWLSAAIGPEMIVAYIVYAPAQFVSWRTERFSKRRNGCVWPRHQASWWFSVWWRRMIQNMYRYRNTRSILCSKNRVDVLSFDLRVTSNSTVCDSVHTPSVAIKHRKLPSGEDHITQPSPYTCFTGLTLSHLKPHIKTT